MNSSAPSGQYFVGALCAPTLFTQFEMAEIAMAAAMPDLKFLFDREGVANDVQVRIYEAGILNMRQFAAFASDSEELRMSLKEDFGLDPAAGLPTKIAISKIVVAWDAGGRGKGRGPAGPQARPRERLQDHEGGVRGKVVEA